MKENRGSWYLLTGLLLGLAVGVVYSWIMQPVRYTDTAPSTLNDTNKDQYRALIASAFAANGDLVRAQARLKLLEDENPYRSLAEQAQRYLAAGKSVEETRGLGILAAAIQNAQSTLFAPLKPTALSSPALIQTEELISGTETATLSAATPINQVTLVSVDASTTVSATGGSPVAAESPTPSFTPSAPFVLNTREEICDPAMGEAQIQVMAFNAAGQQVPGVEVIVIWEGGEDHFFTGLKPNLGAGYADFTMTPGVTYTLWLANGGEQIDKLSVPKCTDANGKPYWGVWALDFVQP